jgi:hypothetical protein
MRQSRKISFAALLAIVILSLVWISLKAPIGYAIATSGLYLFLILVHKPASHYDAKGEHWRVLGWMGFISALICAFYSWMELGSWVDFGNSLCLTMGIFYSLLIAKYIYEMIAGERQGR